MGGTLVTDATPKHVVSLEYDIVSRGWKNTAISRKIPITFVPGNGNQKEEEFSNILLRVVDYESPSVSASNDWNLNIQFSTCFPKNQSMFLIIETQSKEMILQCADKTHDEINQWIVSNEPYQNYKICLFGETEELIIAIQIDQTEKVSFMWTIQIKVQESNKDLQQSSLKNRILHENLPVFVIQKKKTKKQEKDIIPCKSKTTRIKYHNIYFESIKI